MDLPLASSRGGFDRQLRSQRACRCGLLGACRSGEMSAGTAAIGSVCTVITAPQVPGEAWPS